MLHKYLSNNLISKFNKNIHFLFHPYYIMHRTHIYPAFLFLFHTRMSRIRWGNRKCISNAFTVPDRLVIPHVFLGRRYNCLWCGKLPVCTMVKLAFHFELYRCDFQEKSVWGVKDIKFKSFCNVPTLSSFLTILSQYSWERTGK